MWEKMDMTRTGALYGRNVTMCGDVRGVTTMYDMWGRAKALYRCYTFRYIEYQSHHSLGSVVSIIAIHIKKPPDYPP